MVSTNGCSNSICIGCNCKTGKEKRSEVLKHSVTVVFQIDAANFCRIVTVLTNCVFGILLLGYYVILKDIATLPEGSLVIL
jgi:hypothetical protein